MPPKTSLAGIFVLAFAFSIHGQGGLDLTFNPGTGPVGNVYSVAVAPNGKIYVGGFYSTFNGYQRNNLTRVFSDGTLDFGFEVGEGPNGQVYSIIPLSDGKVIIAGNFSHVNGVPHANMARLREDGSLDISFPEVPFNTTVQRAELLPNGQFLVVGNFSSIGATTRRNVARINSNGTLDSFFNPAAGVSPSEVVSAAAVLPENKVLLAGNFQTINSVNRRFLARVSTNGVVDTTFDAGAIAGSEVSRMLVQPDGKIIVFGNFSSIDGYSRQGIARLETNGAVDTTFVLPNGITGVAALGMQADGRLLCAGSFAYTAPPPTPYNQLNILRLNANGSGDATFRPTLASSVNSLALQPDGRILLCGPITQLNGTNVFRVVRLWNGATSTGAVSQVSITMHAGITVSGTAGDSYRVDSTTNLNTPTLWTPVTNVTLSGNSATTFDPIPVTRRQTYYRAVLTP